MAIPSERKWHPGLGRWQWGAGNAGGLNVGGRGKRRIKNGL